MYGKDTVDLQAEDWSAWLSDSSYLTQRVDYIQLSNDNPIVDSIIVYVDQEITDKWSYIQDTHTVQLDFIPNYGSVVEVGYNVYVS